MLNGWSLLAVAAAGAVGYSVHTLYDNAALLVFASTAAWLILCHPIAGGAARALAIFLAMTYAMALISLVWLAEIGISGWLIAPLFYIVHLVPTFVLSRTLFALWPTTPLSVLWPLSFTAGEWLRIVASPGEVPFCQLAQSFVAFPRLIQVVDLGGSWILSGIAASTAGLITSVALPRLTGGRRSLKFVTREAILPTLLLLGTLAYGEFQLRRSFQTVGPQALIAQPNTPTLRDDVRAVDRINDLIGLTRESLLKAPVDVIVWPENSLILDAPDDSRRSSDRIDLLRVAARDFQAPIVADGSFHPSISERERHAVAVVFPSGALERSDKQLLVPWSEYVPFRPDLNRLSPGFGDSFERFVRARNPHLRPVDPGTSLPRLFELTGSARIVFAVPICYELLSSRAMNAVYADALRKGTRLMFVANVVNERLLGGSVHRQTLAYSRLRAVEGRVTVLRAANNGISVAIDPNGNLQQPIDGAAAPPVNSRGALRARVLFDSRFGTLYTRLGDYVPMGCLVLVISLIAVALIRARLSRWNSATAVGK